MSRASEKSPTANNASRSPSRSRRRKRTSDDNPRCITNVRKRRQRKRAAETDFLLCLDSLKHDFAVADEQRKKLLQLYHDATLLITQSTLDLRHMKNLLSIAKFQKKSQLSIRIRLNKEKKRMLNLVPIQTELKHLIDIQTKEMDSLSATCNDISDVLSDLRQNFE